MEPHNSNQTTETNAKTNTNLFDFNIKELIIKYLKKWYWFVISLAICLIVALVYLKTQPFKFEVQTSILLRQNDKKSAALKDAAMLEALGVMGMTKDVEDEMQILQSKTLMREVLDTLNIKTDYYVKSDWIFVDLYKRSPLLLVAANGDPDYNDTIKGEIEFTIEKHSKGFRVDVKIDKKTKKVYIDNLFSTIETPAGSFKFVLTKEKYDPDATYRIIAHQTNVLVEDYCNSITIANSSKKSNAITIKTTSAAIEKSKDILNMIVHLYNVDAINDKNLVASNTKSFIEERIKLIQRDLFDVEFEVESYKKKNSITDISTDAKLFLQSSNEYGVKRAKLETELQLVNYLFTYIKNEDNKYDMIPSGVTNSGENKKNNSNYTLSKNATDGSLLSSSGVDDIGFRLLVEEYNELILSRMKIVRTTNNSNPVIVQLDQQLNVMRENILASIVNMKKSITIALNEIINKENLFNAKIKDIPTQERQYIELKRQQVIFEELYVFLRQKQEETIINLASATPSAKTLDRAYASVSQVSPKEKTTILFALLIGFLIPLCIIYVYYLLNDSIQNKQELKKILLPPLVGSIGINKSSEKVVVTQDTPISEMFRQVRANMQFMLSNSVNKDKPTILITSSISGEGKSFISINIASIFALTKKKTILIGLDVRAPKLQTYLNITSKKGLSIYLSDSECKLDDIIFTVESTGLDVIPTGPIPPNPSELLLSERLGELFNQLKEKYDCIIVDSAPIALISDTFTINKYIDSTIFVVREGYTPREAVNNLNELYTSKQLNNIAVVYNAVENTTYGYGQNYGYGDYFKKKK